MKRIIFYTFLFISTWSFSQIHGVVSDSLTKETLPFVNILVNSGPKGGITNIDGKFHIKADSFDSLRITFVGYNEKTLYSFKNGDTIYLSKSNSELKPIDILPGINPAHRIIKLASKNRKENNPNSNINYKLETYNKFLFTGDLEMLQGIEEKDSNEIDLMETLEKQHLFMIESVSATDHHKTTGSQNKILATKTSGIQNPLIAAIFTQLQSFSFYDNVLELGGYSFISPLAPGGKQRYIYILKDSIKKGDHYTYRIEYQPKPKKNFDGLKGTLYINSENYAMEKISASPTVNIQGATISILQNYEKIGEHWFPLELLTEIKIANITANNVPLKGIGKSYIRNVELNPEVKFGNNGFSLEVEDGAEKQDSIFWASKRKDSITVKENETYRIVDSIAQSRGVEKRLEVIQSILKGRIPVFFIDLDLFGLVNFNQFEGFILGINAHTNQRVSKWFEIGGFFRYGFKDKRWKYGGDVTFNLYRKRQLYLNIDFREDVAFRGGRDFLKRPSPFATTESYFRIFHAPREYMRKFEVKMGGYIRGNLEAQVFANYQRRYYFDDYRYASHITEEFSSDKYDLFEVGFRARYTVKEKVIQSQGNIISLGSKYPTFQLTYKQGIKGVFNSRYSYANIQLQVEQNFELRGVGELQLQLNGTTTFGRVPLSELKFANGTNTKIGVSVQNSFETMVSGEFLSDRYAALFATMKFNSIKTGLSWTAPQFSLSSAAGFGTLSNENYHQNFDFKTMEKGYYESGVILNNLLQYQFLGAGFGVFYKYGPYASIYEKDNFAYKLAITMSF